MADKETGWTDKRPDENGIYWFKQSGMLPEVLLLHGGFVYDFGDKEPTSVGFYDGRGEWLGPLYAADFEQLAALRATVEIVDKWFSDHFAEIPCTIPIGPVTAALRKALSKGE